MAPYVTGYEGTRCEGDIDECLNNTNICGAGTCYNNQGSFSCVCSDGYFGAQCQVWVSNLLSSII